MNKVLLVFLSFCLFIGLIIFNTKQSAKNNETIVVGTNSEFLPFSFVENGEIIGFDIDVAREVTKRLGKKMVLKDMPFDALIPDLSLGNVDFIAAGMSYTDERAKRVSFTKSYISQDPLVILTLAKFSPSESIKLEDLTHKTVVVNEGYSADVFLSDNTKLNLIRLSVPADAFLAISNGRADAFVTAESTVRAFLEKKDRFQFRYDVIEGTTETCAIVVSKKNSKLLSDIQTVLDSMQNDGTMDQFKNKWKLK